MERPEGEWRAGSRRAPRFYLLKSGFYLLYCEIRLRVFAVTVCPVPVRRRAFVGGTAAFRRHWRTNDGSRTDRPVARRRQRTTLRLGARRAVLDAKPPSPLHARPGN